MLLFLPLRVVASTSTGNIDENHSTIILANGMTVGEVNKEKTIGRAASARQTLKSGNAIGKIVLSGF
ncbi:MAG TPA: hypothetical protein VEH06_07710 [Candidatus Bathyarchaeia archaeon]|nr:hypothetical protein [Candidatus Bathyarchaeia archaeon]